MPKVKSDGFEIYYETHGTGEPLVLIPGFASGAWTWFRQTEDLAENFQVTFDPRGVSRSQVSDGETISLRKIADDVAALLDELKIESANVLGASFGGFVAQEFALAYPRKLKKLILVCTSFGGKNHIAPAWEVLAAFVSTDDFNKPERIERFMIPAFAPDFYAEHGEVVETVCKLREQNAVPERVYLAQLQAAIGFDAEARVAEIRAETLVLTGDADVVVPPQNSVNLSRAIPNAELKIVEGSHMFFIEKADEFNKTVSQFVLRP
jgi:pimeloyl-ACP methyl ester carboxylesterase